MDSMAKRIYAKLKPTLDKAGYTEAKAFTHKGQPFRLNIKDINQEHAFVGSPDWAPCIDIFESHAYPNDREEIFINVWNAIGNSFKAQSLLKVIRDDGFTARITHYKKCHGIAIKMTYEDLNDHPL